MKDFFANLKEKLIGFYDYTVIATYLSLFLGALGVFYAVNGSPMTGLILLMACGIIDMFDGKIASTKERTMVEKRYGLQIDVLSDMVAFGLLPVAIGYGVGLHHAAVIPAMALYAVAVQIRLAYFNVAQEARLQQGDHPFRYYEGFPVNYISLVLPVIYLLRGLVGDNAFKWIYLIVLLAVIPTYLLKFKVIKPRFRGLMVLLGVGFVELLLLLLLGK